MVDASEEEFLNEVRNHPELFKIQDGKISLTPEAYDDPDVIEAMGEMVTRVDVALEEFPKFIAHMMEAGIECAVQPTYPDEICVVAIIAVASKERIARAVNTPIAIKYLPLS